MDIRNNGQLVKIQKRNEDGSIQILYHRSDQTFNFFLTKHHIIKNAPKLSFDNANNMLTTFIDKLIVKPDITKLNSLLQWGCNEFDETYKILIAENVDKMRNAILEGNYVWVKDNFKSNMIMRE